MNIYSLLHILIILLAIIIPLIICNCKYLSIYIILMILIIMHWKFNNNECILTNLEKNKYPEEFTKNNNEGEDGFISKYLKDYGFESVTNFEYLTEVITLLLILVATAKIYWFL